MMQRGTGERFKYKAKVLESKPNAKCSKVYVLGKFLFIVNDGEYRLSIPTRSAEEAWADVYCKIMDKRL